MTIEEVYAICKLIFPDKMMRFNGCEIRIDWYYKEIRKCIWIEEHCDYIRIEHVGMLPSWFKDKVDYEYDKREGKIFKGFKDCD